jgi:hypothetical protein
VTGDALQIFRALVGGYDDFTDTACGIVPRLLLGDCMALRCKRSADSTGRHQFQFVFHPLPPSLALLILNYVDSRWRLSAIRHADRAASCKWLAARAWRSTLPVALRGNSA